MILVMKGLKFSLASSAAAFNSSPVWSRTMWLKLLKVSLKNTVRKVYRKIVQAAYRNDILKQSLSYSVLCQLVADVEKSFLWLMR